MAGVQEGEWQGALNMHCVFKLVKGEGSGRGCVRGVADSKVHLIHTHSPISCNDKEKCFLQSHSSVLSIINTIVIPATVNVYSY